MENSDQIIIKFSSNFPGLFRNASKFILYLNTLFAKESKGSFFIETLGDGLLYIYNNKETFDLLNTKTSPSKMVDLIKNTELKLNPEMLIDGIIDKSTFPESGVDFQYNFYTNQKQHFYRELLSFHQSLYKEGIKIITSEKYDLVFTIKNFDDFFLYIQNIALLANGIIV